ncbi:MAG: hypothetical protein UT33_C0010G0029 [Candidatus Peregrinibacteria bacterium GW2011_GWC2_39_14]|nr:MAG: hypothetical protein US92_C0006G0029 [Candidatus Peregrinibacteria bacterium GW2011_GWA2_38_36]KKR05886.1 MAG: hypothetical protein UT33_C0010G0029 [Candidatus Peregrinibacteria bacterium GW2011_GWC2_39_14]
MEFEDILLAGHNKKDYIRAITTNKPWVTLIDQGENEFVELREHVLEISEHTRGAISGTLEVPIEVGKKIVLTMPNGKTKREIIKSIEIKEVEPRETILIKTPNRVYELVIARNEAEHASLKFLQNGYLDYDDPVPNGFFVCSARGGEEIYLTTENGLYIRARIGEMMLFDSRKDETLKYRIQQARKLTANAKNDKAKALILAGYVSECLGGPDFAEKYEEESVKLRENETKYESNGEFILIGDYKIGVCAQKSILFKYLADRIGLKCRLIDGMLFGDTERAIRYRKGTGDNRTNIFLPHDKIKSEGMHMWNVVEIEGKNYLMDIENSPSELIEEKEPRTKRHVRANGGNIITGGMGGHSVLFRREDMDKD